MAYEEGDKITASGTISKKYDAVTALLLGIIWDECEENKGQYCNDSYMKLAERIGVSIRTINEKIKILIDDGLIVDVGNDKSQGITKTYSCNRDKILKITYAEFAEVVNEDSHEDVKDGHTHAKIAEVSSADVLTLSKDDQKEELFQKNKKMFLDKFYQNKTWNDENDFWLKVLFMRNENSQRKVYSDLYEAPKRFNGKEMTEYLIEKMKKYVNA